MFLELSLIVVLIDVNCLSKIRILGDITSPRQLHQLLALHGEDVALEGFVLARGLTEGLAVSGYLLLGECRYIGASSSEFLTVSDLFFGGRYGDLTD